MTDLSHQRLRTFGGALGADVFRGGQADAEALMRKHGVKGPKRCRCENPHGYRDEDEVWHCHKCGGAS